MQPAQPVVVSLTSISMNFVFFPLYSYFTSPIQHGYAFEHLLVAGGGVADRVS
jgi:hypothetical protein